MSAALDRDELLDKLAKAKAAPTAALPEPPGWMDEGPPPEEPHAEPVSIATPDRTTPSQSLRLIGLDEYATRPSIVHLVRDLIPASSIIVVFGAPKSGKTHAVADLAMHVAHGMHWHGHTISRALRVAYLAGEGHTGLRVRLHAWQRHHEAELRGDMRILPQALSLAGRIPELLDLLREYTPDIVIADTLNAYFGGADENSTQDMTAFVAAVRRLRDEIHCAVILIHHTGLADATRERGSSVLRAAADAIVQVARDEGGSGSIGIQLIEARDLEPWSEALSLRLERAETDWADDEGVPITTCLPMASDTPVTLPGRGRPMGEAQSSILTVAHELANGLPRDKDGYVLLARQALATACQERGIDRRRVSESLQRLARRKLVRLLEPGSVAVRVRG